MSLEQLQCPACGAPVTIPAGAGQANCGFCGTALRVQRSDGEVALQATQQMAQAITDSSTQTQAAIGANAAVTREELRRVQLAQELSGLELRLASVQSEMRALNRMPPTKVTAQQRKQLGEQEASLHTRIGQVQAMLNPPPASLPAAPSSAARKKEAAQGSEKKRGCVGWALLVLAWFFFWPFMLPWKMIHAQSKLVRIAGYVVAVIVAIYFLLALFAPRKSRTPAVETPAAFAAPQVQRYGVQNHLAGAVGQDISCLYV